MAKSKRQRRESGAARRRERREEEKQNESYQGTSLKLPPGINFFNIDSDDTRKIIIPDYVVGEGNRYADKGQLHFERTYWVHRIGPKNASYVCPKKTCGKPCPVCDEFEEMQRAGADWDDFKHLKAKERQLYVAKEDGDEEWKVWDVSTFVFGEKLDAELKNAEDGEFDFFSDWEDGMYLRMSFKRKPMPKRKGMKKAPEFFEITSINFKPRDPLSQEEIDSIPCLDDMIIVHTYEKIKAVLEGEDLEEDDDKEEEKEDREEKKERKRKPPVEDDDDDFDDDERTEDIDEDGDEDDEWDDDFDD